MKIFYCDVKILSLSDFEGLLKLLPSLMQAEVMKFKNDIDRKARLMARVMLLNSLRESGVDFYINSVKKNSNGKPFIEGWDYFNLSHSGHYVIMAQDSQPVGIDIERVRSVDIKAIEQFFHTEERNYISQASDKIDAFYEIWVRKESFLKATGQGLTDDFHNFSVFKKSINFSNIDWFFYDLLIDINYKCYLCINADSIRYEIVKFDREIINNLLGK